MMPLYKKGSIINLAGGNCDLRYVLKKTGKYLKVNC